MKKTLAALAVLGAFAGSAVAADVTLYGLVDYGFNYQHRDGDAAADAQDSFEMRSGMNSGSRFGLKGTEDLGNGLTVGFVLENGFDADDGTFDSNGDDRMFGRESQLYIQGNFGTLSFGRVGQLASANGSYALLGKTSPFSSGWGDSIGQKFVTAKGWSRYDNMVTYKTPEFAGVQVHAQYSFKTNSSSSGTGDEGKSNTDRYYGVAATYTTGNLYLVGIVDSVNYAQPAADQSNLDDSMTVTLGGNYNFGFMTVYAMGQYFDNAKSVGQKNLNVEGEYNTGITSRSGEGFEGYGIALGVGVPAFGGTAKAHVGYMDAEDKADKNDDGFKTDFTRWSVAVGYDYNLSKRTSVYTAAAYTKDSIDWAKDDSRDPSSVEVMAGLIHKF